VSLEGAIAAKVPHLVHIGIINNDRTDLLWHHALDGTVQSSGISFTILRNNLHTEAFLPAFRLARDSGELAGAFGNQIVAPASRFDYAEAAAIALTEDGQSNRIHELSGFGLTGLGIASGFSLVADRSINLREVPVQDVAAALKSKGASQEVAEELEDLYSAASRGEFSPNTDTLDKLLGHPHMLNEEAIRNALDAA
jgi:NAD(P)H dehydrogenase (quinone)